MDQTVTKVEQSGNPSENSVKQSTEERPSKQAIRRLIRQRRFESSLGLLRRSMWSVVLEEDLDGRPIRRRKSAHLMHTF